MTRKANITGIVGVAAFPVSFIALQILNPSFDFVHNPLSQMIYGNWGWLVTFGITALGFGVLSQGLRYKGILRIVLYLIALCVFVMAIVPGVPLGASIHGAYLVHDVANKTVACLIPICCLIVYARTRSLFSLTLGVIGIALIVIYILGMSLNWEGIRERAVVANGVLWFIKLSIDV